VNGATMGQLFALFPFYRINPHSISHQFLMLQNHEWGE
jgi:hypothetical protein